MNVCLQDAEQRLQYLTAKLQQRKDNQNAAEQQLQQHRLHLASTKHEAEQVTKLLSSAKFPLRMLQLSISHVTRTFGWQVRACCCIKYASHVLSLHLCSLHKQLFKELDLF